MKLKFWAIQFSQLQIHQEQTEITHQVTHKVRLANEDADSKNLFPPGMYAHLCHTDGDLQDEDKSASKRMLQYYPQTHQFQSINSSSTTSKAPFTLTSPLFSTQPSYNGHHMNNLHDGIIQFIR